MKILSVEVSVIAHATEDPKKVLQALRNIFPDTTRSETKVTTQHLKGHHGNPINRMRTDLKKAKAINQFFDHLMNSLEVEDQRLIVENMDTHMDEEGNLYLRVDKQAAYMGEVRLKQEDPIRIRVKLIDDISKRSLTADQVKELLLRYEEVC